MSNAGSKHCGFPNLGIWSWDWVFTLGWLLLHPQSLINYIRASLPRSQGYSLLPGPDLAIVAEQRSDRGLFQFPVSPVQVHLESAAGAQPFDSARRPILWERRQQIEHAQFFVRVPRQ